jgi:hypothetical protein
MCQSASDIFKVLPEVSGSMGLSISILPQPIPESGDPSSSLAALLQRLQALKRVASTVERPMHNIIVTSWIDPQLYPQNRYNNPQLDQLENELASAWVRSQGIHIIRHVSIILRLPVHDALEATLQACDSNHAHIGLADIIEKQKSMEKMQASPFTQHVERHIIQCPPYIRDNYVDAMVIAYKIIGCLKTVPISSPQFPLPPPPSLSLPPPPLSLPPPISLPLSSLTKEQYMVWENELTT